MKGSTEGQEVQFEIMKRYQLFILLLMLIGTGSIRANDGVYFANGSQLVPIRETDISVAKEVLTISLCDDGFARVEVDYEFMNHGIAKTVQMGFEAMKPYNTVDTLNPTGIHPYIKDFTVVMNGEQLAYHNAVVEPGELDTPYTGPKDDRPEECTQGCRELQFRHQPAQQVVIDDEEPADYRKPDPSHGTAVADAFPDRGSAGNAAGRFIRLDLMMVMIMAAGASRTMFMMMFVVIMAHGITSLPSRYPRSF